MQRVELPSVADEELDRHRRVRSPIAWNVTSLLLLFSLEEQRQRLVGLSVTTRG